MQHIAVSYRDGKSGKGPFFDHMTLRNITKWPTRIVKHDATKTDVFQKHIAKRVTDGCYGLPINTALPELSPEFGRNAAFLFIPGYTRDADQKQPVTHVNRLVFEAELIRKAKYRGQPVLAVCAGSWTLWKSFGGKTKAVSHHSYRAGMPRAKEAEPKVNYNVKVHDIETINGTFLHQAMFANEAIYKTAVNSVHWNAVDVSTIADDANVQVCALSKRSASINITTGQKTKMTPEDCVEAFETIHGVPMIGIQWHPEAYNVDDADAAPQLGIFKAIQVAGSTYLNRQNLNDEFKGVWRSQAHSSNSFFKQKSIEHVDDGVQEIQQRLAKL